MLVVLFALGLAAVVAVDAGAAMHGKKKHGGMGAGMTDCRMDEGNPMLMKLMSLGLDDRQKEQVQAVHMNMRKNDIRGRADIAVAEIELREILLRDPVDLNAAEAKLKHIESLKTALHFGRIKAHEEVKAILTPAQKKKLGPMMMGMGHDGRGGMGCGCMYSGMGLMHGQDGMGMRSGMGMGRGMRHGCRMMEGMGQPGDDDSPGEDKEEDTAPAAEHQH